MNLPSHVPKDYPEKSKWMETVLPNHVRAQVTDGLSECFSPLLRVFILLKANLEPVLAKEMGAGTMHCEIELHHMPLLSLL